MMLSLLNKDQKMELNWKSFGLPLQKILSNLCNENIGLNDDFINLKVKNTRFFNFLNKKSDKSIKFILFVLNHFAYFNAFSILLMNSIRRDLFMARFILTIEMD